jgi:hypothetical protein
MRPQLVALALLLGLVRPGAAAETIDPARVRQELRFLEVVLDRAVAAVSAPNPGFVLAGAPHSRGYVLKGAGIVVVIPPRRLAVHRSAFVRPSRGAGRPPKERPDRVVVMKNERDPDLRDLEAQVEAFQIEAERQRVEAERAFQDMTRRLFERLAAAEASARASGMGSGAAIPPAAWASEGTEQVAKPQAPTPPALPAPPTVQASPATPPPASAPDAPLTPAAPVAVSPPPAPTSPGAPWFFWVGEEFSDPEPRGPERLLTEVREAVVAALEDHGPSITSVRGDETISVLVDFVAGTPFLDEDARPARSLSLRVRKRDLDDRKAGRLAGEELRRRVEAAEY